uniref:Thioredoxin-like-1 protein n=1 Tax=Coenobita clypeatus TaxID=474045 RepID=W6MEU4_9EUCA
MCNFTVLVESVLKCKVIAPKLEAMSQQKTHVVFLKVDVDDSEDVAQEYKITCMPTFVFFKDGKKVDSFSGANEEKIKEFIEKYE